MGRKAFVKRTTSPPPPPPPPPPQQQKPAVRLPPSQPRPPPSSSTPKPAPGPGGFSLDLSQLKNLRAGLRKVSVGPGVGDSKAEPGAKSGPKTYTDVELSVSDAKRKFQEKADGKPGFLTQKPAITPKLSSWKAQSATSSSSTLPTPKPRGSSPDPAHSRSTSSSPVPKPPSSSLPRPSPQVEVAEDPSPSRAPDVTFLHKASKHTTVPLPPVPAPSKPVATFEPPSGQWEESEDIYDDACSGDLLDRYDWFHGMIDRKQADVKVKSNGKDGTYLVRVSEKDPRFPYTLVVLHNGHINNLRIRLRDDQKFALGEEKAEELKFADVAALIQHHQKHHVVLLGGSQSTVVLQHTPSKR
ncbi:uncharacterized protein LOC143294241 [Babylonia areolata]|uniref:uncharacterized protein LOC143294241 n=1 Tax=Babylonia areolata TaxID=304850 RepID=UPI003FD443F5